MLDTTRTLAKRQWDPDFEKVPTECIDRITSNTADCALFAKEAEDSENDDWSDDEELTEDPAESSDDDFLVTFCSPLNDPSPFPNQSSIIQDFCRNHTVGVDTSKENEEVKLAMVEEFRVERHGERSGHKWFGPDWSASEFAKYMHAQVGTSPETALGAVR
ncbi:uncharacterized protein B0I36DRAFT_410708 [Microdochium trichocladiopsis]|uniref:Uncharacterized protein n=1 Tax=Microdochium trichocladiopsis TaxID=1682393 RepID=A0A9P9BSP2_9PEZI|nr:uncharacterized protein B0I36DRAFT_410708 [Microdochium trichocladiopsis]KAH7029036.1 hypothetical protein B0I36DRAFT_410708 [Microdochium trichocladiopsis]